MFGRAATTLGIGPHFSSALVYYLIVGRLTSFNGSHDEQSRLYRESVSLVFRSAVTDAL